MTTESNILKLARLFRVLESDGSKEEKVTTIKLFQEDGIITLDEAIDLAIEYFTK